MLALQQAGRACWRAERQPPGRALLSEIDGSGQAWRLALPPRQAQRCLGAIPNPSGHAGRASRQHRMVNSSRIDGAIRSFTLDVLHPVVDGAAGPQAAAAAVDRAPWFRSPLLTRPLTPLQPSHIASLVREPQAAAAQLQHSPPRASTVFVARVLRVADGATNSIVSEAERPPLLPPRAAAIKRGPSWW